MTYFISMSELTMAGVVSVCTILSWACISPRPISFLGPSALGLILESRADTSCDMEKVLAVGVYSACPRGWLAVSDDCLMFAKGRLSWIDAAKSCKHNNESVLVTIDSYDKMAQINTIAKVLASPTIGMIGFWTGGNDFGIEGVWRWEETNEQISGFTNWAPGSPDGKSAENCMTVGFAPNSTDTFWKDAPCSGHHNYICQFSLNTGGSQVIGRK